MPLYSLHCADVPLRNCSLIQPCIRPKCTDYCTFTDRGGWKAKLACWRSHSGQSNHKEVTCQT